MRTPLPPRRAFTLVEVLAALMLLGIVLPVALRGVQLALAAADSARHADEAAQLAELKLNELTATGELVSATSGDFGTEWPGYQWTLSSAAVINADSLTKWSITVTWTARGQMRDFTLTTYRWEPSTSTGLTP